MEIKNFEILLSDLYNLYNPSKKKEVERIIDTYNGREYDAVKTILIRYNFKGHPSYQENANREDYVQYLLTSYDNGERVISKENIIKQTQEEELQRIEQTKVEEELRRLQNEQDKKSIVELAENVKEQIKREVDELVNKQLQEKFEEMFNFFNLKEKEIKEREENIKTIQSEIVNFSGQALEVMQEVNVEKAVHTQINIENLNFTDADIKLPSQEVLETLAKGTRLILENSEGRVCGIEVKDVTYDLISYKGEIVKEIILEKI
jgi:hypothetical protein